jgi:hypothetical protein
MTTGMHAPIVIQDSASWRTGYRDGLAGDCATPPPGLDGLAYVSGLIEGRAARVLKVVRLPIHARQAR